MTKKLTSKEFIEKARVIHQNKYDYSEVVYLNSLIKVKIICPIHGAFIQTPNKHLSKHGCLNCSKTRKITNEEFIFKANKTHKNTYDYNECKYINMHKKVKIKCLKHGMFEQAPDSHLKGQGCPKCKSSKGEQKIKNFLLENNLNFEEQKRFKDCKHKNCLPFDFYLPDHNICIEFQGEQHFKPARWSKNKEKMLEKLNLIQTRDQIKRDYCKKNNIKLFEISYKDYNNIERILNKLIFI